MRGKVAILLKCGRAILRSKPVQGKCEADNLDHQPKSAKTKAQTQTQAWCVHLAPQQEGDGDEDAEDPGNLVREHKQKEEAAHPLVQVVVKAEEPFCSWQSFNLSCSSL